MNKYQITFTVKNGMVPFTEVVTAATTDEARTVLNKLVQSYGMQLKQITLIIVL